MKTSLCLTCIVSFLVAHSDLRAVEEPAASNDELLQLRRENEQLRSRNDELEKELAKADAAKAARTTRAASRASVPRPVVSQARRVFHRTRQDRKIPPYSVSLARERL